MTPERAAELASMFEVPTAAAPLIMAACDPAPSQEAARARRALRALDPDEPVSGWLEVIASAWADILVECLRTADDRERQRLGALVRQVLAEAAAISARQRRAA